VLCGTLGTRICIELVTGTYINVALGIYIYISVCTHIPVAVGTCICVAISVAVVTCICVAKCTYISVAVGAYICVAVRRPACIWVEIFFHRFHDRRHATLSKTSLDEWSARRRDLYLSTPNTHNRQTSLHLAGFEPTIPASERPQTHTLDRRPMGSASMWR
jgi:hypothetical protein